MLLTYFLGVLQTPQVQLSAMELIMSPFHFNDPRSPYDVLVTSLTLAAFGVNFHGCCHNSVEVEEPVNITTLFEALGR